MTEAELRRRLREEPLPGELEAGERSLEVVRAAFSSRERVPPLRRRARPLLALAVVAALVGATVSPPGRAVVERIRDTLARGDESGPALVRLPSPGLLLVDSAHGPWVVHQDGSKRLVGAYESASWSPHAQFVVATGGRRVVALEPGGEVRWTLTRPRRVAQARWAPSGYRIAYREGNTLRVVIGNGEGDRLVARSAAAVAPAWRPGPANVLAYADPTGRVHVLDVDSRRELWVTPAGPPITELAWSSDGRRLAGLSSGERQRIWDGRGGLATTIGLPAGHVVVRAAFAPRGEALAYTDFDPATRASTVAVHEHGTARTLFSAAGRLQDVAWSPNGRWVLVTWPSADQWLFLRVPGVRRIVTVLNVIREFDPGATGPRIAPRVAGWCCP